MLSTFEIVINAFFVCLVPIVLLSLLGFSKVPPGSLLARFYAAGPLVQPTGDVMVLALAAKAFAALGQHFGVIGADTAGSITAVADPMFLMLLAAYGVLSIMAHFKMRRTSNGDA